MYKNCILKIVSISYMYGMELKRVEKLGWIALAKFYLKQN